MARINHVLFLVCFFCFFFEPPFSFRSFSRAKMALQGDQAAVVAEMERVTTEKGALQDKLGDVSEELRKTRSDLEALQQAFAALKQQHADLASSTSATMSVQGHHSLP